MTTEKVPAVIFYIEIYIKNYIYPNFFQSLFV